MQPTACQTLCADCSCRSSSPYGSSRPIVYPGQASSAQAAVRLANPAEATQGLPTTSCCRSSTTADSRGNGSQHQHSCRHQQNWLQGVGNAASMACGGIRLSQQQPCPQHLHVMPAVRPAPPGALLLPARVFTSIPRAGRQDKQAVHDGLAAPPVQLACPQQAACQPGSGRWYFGSDLPQGEALEVVIGIPGFALRNCAAIPGHLAPAGTGDSTLQHTPGDDSKESEHEEVTPGDSLDGRGDLNTSRAA